MIRNIYLQRFAEGEPGEDTGAADQNPAADAGQAPEGTKPPEGEKTPDEGKDKDPAKAFAARLGHERKKMEAEYTPYKAVIEKQAKAAGMEPGDYLKYIQEQQEKEELEDEANRTGKTPEQIKVEREKAEADARLAKFEKKEKLTAEEKELASDPKIGKFVTDNLGRIRAIAEESDTDLRTGLALVLMEKLPELLDNADIERHRDRIVKEYLESVKKGGKPIEIGGGTPLPDSKQPKTFDEARQAAMEMLRATNKN